MPLSLSIDPITPTIEMYDSPDTASAYSLSGHITITLTPSLSLLSRTRPAPQSLLLTSLELNFEGQSELILTDIAYKPLRIISLSKELVDPAHPVPITSDSNTDDRAEWRVVFNLPVPGWLPATNFFGDHEDQEPAGITYALHARARFLSAEDVPAAPGGGTSSSVWTNFRSAVRMGSGRTRTIDAERCPVTIVRYVTPPSHTGDPSSSPAAAFPRSTFAIQAVPETTPGSPTSTDIPADILRSVQLHAMVPTCTSVDDATVPLVLRLRCRAINDAVRSQMKRLGSPLKVLGFEADIVQLEKFNLAPPPSYTSRFPLPPPSEQPPHRPLRTLHPYGALYELGLVSCVPQGKHVIREHSLVPPGASRQFKVRGGAGGIILDENWVKMEVAVPVMQGLGIPGAAGLGVKRIAARSPSFDVKHEMRVRVTVGCDRGKSKGWSIGMGGKNGSGGSGDVISDELAFTVPLEFALVTPEPTQGTAFAGIGCARAASSYSPVARSNSHSRTHTCSTTPYNSSRSNTPYSSSRSNTPYSSSRDTPSPYASHSSHSHSRSYSPSSSPSPPPPHPSLPAYSQLFHENGERKDVMGLPVYREREDDDTKRQRHRHHRYREDDEEAEEADGEDDMEEEDAMYAVRSANSSLRSASSLRSNFASGSGAAISRSMSASGAVHASGSRSAPKSHARMHSSPRNPNPDPRPKARSAPPSQERFFRNGGERRGAGSVQYGYAV